MKYRLRNSWIDYVAIGVVLVASILFALFFYLAPQKGNVVGVYYNGTRIRELKLNEDLTWTLYPSKADDPAGLQETDYPHLLGPLTIEVKGGRVRVSKEESPKHLCSRQGWVEQSGFMITCLPNDLYLIVEGEADDRYDTPPIGSAYYIGSVIYEA